MAPADQPVHFLDRVYRSTNGAVAVGVVLEVRLEDRFQHELGGGLYYPIPDGRHGSFELHIGPVSLWDRPRSPTPFIHFEIISLLC
jgi:hypothetical protein